MMMHRIKEANELAEEERKSGNSLSCKIACVRLSTPVEFRYRINKHEERE